MTIFSILAIDPGRTTGLAWRSTVSGTIKTSYTTDVETILHMIPEAAIVVAEDYIGQLISGDGLWTVRLIGIIEGVCWNSDIPLFIQRNAERKAQLQNAKDYLGYPNRKTLIHEVDALAHLLRFEYNTDRNIPHRKRDWHE